MAHASSQILIFIADESYAVGLAAALASIVEHTQPLPSIFVVDARLAADSRQRLSQIAPVSWIEPEAWRQLECSLPVNSSYVSQAAWLKLFIPQLLPSLPGVDRVAYMDCDMLALESLAPLWDVPLQGKLLAAVRDFGMPCGHRGLEPLGWDMSEPYFNAGLMLLDLPRLRHASADAQRLLAAPSGALQYADQDALNVLCCREGWVPLDLRWNAQGLGSYAAFRTRPEPDRPQLFSADQLAMLTASPAVVHFTGPPTVAPSAFLNPHVPFSSKPWAYLCSHPHRQLFFRQLDRTPWAGWRPQQRSLAAAACAELRRFASLVAEPGFDRAAFMEQMAAMLRDKST